MPSFGSSLLLLLLPLLLLLRVVGLPQIFVSAFTSMP
jgi:hypothetical protein